jgi:hypothetical protein
VLIDLFQEQGDVAAIDEAVVLNRTIVDELDPDDGEYVGMLSNLANSLMLAAKAHSDLDLVNESVVAGRAALRELALPMIGWRPCRSTWVPRCYSRPS